MKQAWLVGTRQPPAPLARARRSVSQQDTVGLLGESPLGNAKYILLLVLSGRVYGAWHTEITAFQGATTY